MITPSDSTRAIDRPMTSRRTFLSGMALSLAAVGLAGCSGGGATTRNDLDANRVMPPEGGPEFTLNDSVLYPANFVGPKAYTPRPLVTEKARLKVATIQDSTIGNWETNKVTKWMEERTGISVEWVTLPSGTDLTSKVNAMIGSNDLPDVFFNPYKTVMTLPTLNQNGAGGIFIELDEIINKYCPNAKLALDTYKDQMDQFRSAEGKLYSFPTINDCYHCRSVGGKMWVNQNILDKLGAKIPTTTDEFVQVIKQAKELDKNIQTYTTWNDGGGSLDLRWDVPIFASFGYYPAPVARAVDPDGKVYYPILSNEIREGLKFVAKLTADGVINPSWWNQSAEQLQRVTPQDRAFIVASPHPAVMTKTTDPTITRWKSMAPMTGPDGTRLTAWNYYSGADTGGMITRACKTPELAAAWLDVMLEMEATLTTNFGLRGTTWDWSKAGAKGFTGDQAIYTSISGSDNKNNTWNQINPNFRSLSYRDSQQVNEGTYNFEQVLRVESEKNYLPYAQPREWQLPEVPLTVEEGNAAIAPLTDLNTYFLEQLTQFASGRQDPNDDAAWNKFVQGANDRGAQTVVSTYQTAYDRFKQQ